MNDDIRLTLSGYFFVDPIYDTQQNFWSQI